MPKIMSNKLDTFISFIDRSFALLSLTDGNIVSRPIHERELNNGLDHEITSITHILNSNLLITGNLIGEINVWSVCSGSLIRVFQAHSGRINSVCGIPNGCLVSGSNEFKLKVWNITAQNPLIEKLIGHLGFNYSLSILPNGFLASSDTDNQILIWDTTIFSLIKKVTSHFEIINALTILFTNQYLNNEKFLDKVKIWSKTGEELTIIDSANKDSNIICICCIDNSYLATSDLNNNTIKIWHIVTG